MLSKEGERNRACFGDYRIPATHAAGPPDDGTQSGSLQRARYRLLRFLMTHRRNLKRNFLDIENAIRLSIKTFCLKLGVVSRRASRAATASTLVAQSCSPPSTDFRPIADDPAPRGRGRRKADPTGSASMAGLGGENIITQFQ